jgi:hypothetical protein
MKVCVFDFGAPMPADGNDAVTIEASAIDNRGNDIAISPPAVFPLVTRPYVSSMTPGIGPTGGGTEILVKGTDFVLPYGPSKGTELVINGVPLRDVTVTSTEIRGVTERHDPGLAIVRVRNGVAYSTDWPFEFVAAPGVLRIFPPRGPVSGGTWIAVIGSHFRDGETNIVIGDKQLEEICFVSENRVEGRVPGGDAIGGVAVSADDPIGGAGTMFGTFIYDPAESTETDPPEGGLEPMLCPGAQ